MRTCTPRSTRAATRSRQFGYVECVIITCGGHVAAGGSLGLEPNKPDTSIATRLLMMKNDGDTCALAAIFQKTDTTGKAVPGANNNTRKLRRDA